MLSSFRNVLVKFNGRLALWLLSGIFLLCWTILLTKNLVGLEDIAGIIFKHSYSSPYVINDFEPLVDQSPFRNEITESLINAYDLPVAYWLNSTVQMKDAYHRDASCVKYPTLENLNVNNIYWQKLETSDGHFYLYSAFYDDRETISKVRILAMVERKVPQVTVCQLWFEHDPNPIFSIANYIPGWNTSRPVYVTGIKYFVFLITCRLPKNESGGRIPASVSLVLNHCDKSTTNLPVNNHRTVKKNFAVCVKGLDFLTEDLSFRLVEWLELLDILGANKVFFYELEVHRNISKVLKHYQQRGLVDLKPITLPGKQTNLPLLRHFYLQKNVIQNRHNEAFHYNDCFYRNLYSYKYVLIMDIDEVIMPSIHANWSDLMSEVEKQALAVPNTPDSYNVLNFYFMDDFKGKQEDLQQDVEILAIPRFLHMLQHVYRSSNFTKSEESYFKSFHSTESVIWSINHYPLHCIGTCSRWTVGTELARLQHYRKDCALILKDTCDTDYRKFTTRDTTIWKYKDQLVKRSISTLSQLGFL